MRRLILVLALIASVLQPACIWRLWQDPPPLEERTFDVYGTVKSINPEQLVVGTDEGEQTFRMGPASIKGSDFGAGAYVHVYYKINTEGDEQVKEVTMVVEKIG
ncbi:MAG: hypothetical protein ACRD1R_04350 [Acidobacteriota bacterium]